MNTKNKTVRLNGNELTIIENYLYATGLSFTDLCKTAIFEKIEDELDIAVADLAYEEYLTDDKKTFSHAELLELI